MKAEEIAPIAMPGHATEQKPDRQYTTPKDDHTPSSTKINQDTVPTSTPDRIQLSNIEKVNSDSQEAAIQIRQVNQSMETIDVHLSEMQVTLDNLVKIYPPYPPGSSERIEALRQFSALRNMIDQLTLPDRTGGMQSIIAEMDATASSDAVQVQVGNQEIQFSRQPLHTGETGLNLPHLSENATDLEISQALDQTMAAQETLQTRRLDFISEANQVIAHFS